MSLQYSELRSTSGWDRFVSLGHPSKFQLVSRLGSIPNIAALDRGRHLYSAGRPSRWALAHISSWTSFSISYGWGASRQNVSKLAAFRRGGSVWAKISGGRGRPPANILTPLERQLIVLQLCRWQQFLYDETLQQTSRHLLSKLYQRRQI